MNSLAVTGAPETIRTSDLCLRRATLYPAELRAPVRLNRRKPRQRQRPTALQKSPTFCVFMRIRPFPEAANLIGLVERRMVRNRSGRHGRQADYHEALGRHAGRSAFTYEKA